ncbi:MAG TPA: MoxR family ATPase [Acidimicrobiales bacterium]|nr:MoxR family ATPase [Acidimicrobiales bacterium]
MTERAAAPGLFEEAPSAVFSALEEAVAGVVAAERATIRLCIACVAAGGHLLVEDHPGLGKTTLAKAIAGALGLGFRRLQCTADLLPLDVTGATVLGADGASPVWRPGPVFTNVLMADELNRASPRAQSALLEAMEERQVTVDGTTRQLPRPFFVLATQNPFDSAGTSPLPHGQRDRFLLAISLGYPSTAEMDALLAGPDPAEVVRHLPAAVAPAQLDDLMRAVDAVHLSASVRGYVIELVEATRRHPAVAVGASPRAARALVQAARALAVADGRGYLSPDDVQVAARAVLAHRLLLAPGAEVTGDGAEALVDELVQSLPVPLVGGPG